MALKEWQIAGVEIFICFAFYSQLLEDMFSWGSVSLESFGTCCLLENINIQLSRLEKYKAKQIINKINGRKPTKRHDINCI